MKCDLHQMLSNLKKKENKQTADIQSVEESSNKK